VPQSSDNDDRYLHNTADARDRSLINSVCVEPSDGHDRGCCIERSVANETGHGASVTRRSIANELQRLRVESQLNGLPTGSFELGSSRLLELAKWFPAMANPFRM
jgi:hypothetical protein